MKEFAEPEVLGSLVYEAEESEEMDVEHSAGEINALSRRDLGSSCVLSRSDLDVEGGGEEGFGSHEDVLFNFFSLIHSIVSGRVEWFRNSNFQIRRLAQVMEYISRFLSVIVEHNVTILDYKTTCSVSTPETK